jgi:hypothetical protein
VRNSILASAVAVLALLVANAAPGGSGIFANLGGKDGEEL